MVYVLFAASIINIFNVVYEIVAVVELRFEKLSDSLFPFHPLPTVLVFLQIVARALAWIGNASQYERAREIEKKETPEMTEIVLGFEKDWKLVEGMNWRPMDNPRVRKFYEYNKETEKWELKRNWSSN